MRNGIILSVIFLLSAMFCQQATTHPLTDTAPKAGRLVFGLVGLTMSGPIIVHGAYRAHKAWSVANGNSDPDCMDTDSFLIPIQFERDDSCPYHLKGTVQETGNVSTESYCVSHRILLPFDFDFSSTRFVCGYLENEALTITTPSRDFTE